MVQYQHRPAPRRGRIPRDYRRRRGDRQGLPQIPHAHEPLLGRIESGSEFLGAVRRHDD